MQTRLRMLLAAAMLLTALPAAAANYLFRYWGPVTATWVLPAAPVPTVVFDNTFEMHDVPVTVDGTPGAYRLQFWVPDEGGGFSMWPGPIINAYGDALFTGSLDAPMFRTGAFVMDDSGTFGNGVLLITAVPEPQSWALLVIGFAAAGVTLRRQARAAAA